MAWIKTLQFFVLLAAFSSAVWGQREVPLTIERPSSVSAGGAASLRCNLSANNSMLAQDDCSFMTPDGRKLIVNFVTGVVTDSDTSNPAAGYTGIVDDVNRQVCGIDIAAVDEAKDIGEWSCLMNDMAESYFHKGTFQLFLPDNAYLTDVRLPVHLEPTLYFIDLVTHIEEDNFNVDGSARILLRHVGSNNEDNEYASRIVMHAKDIVIHEESIQLTGIQDPKNVIGHEYDLEREFYVIHINEVLYGNVTNTFVVLNLNFDAYLNDDLRGFYRSSYINDAGETKYIATTQFQDIDARRAFPCLDEPNRKAKFQIRLGHHKDLTATSNMVITSTVPMDGVDDYVWDRYRITPDMSTYLVAFLVSDFVNTTTSQDNFNIIHQSGKGDQAALAADAGPAILNYFEDYYGINYLLPKTDMAAIPDFAAGAMENWGLITYRESSLLFDDYFSSQKDRERVILVIAHELAHNWFGNLVTMDWWTDLWLNEGFATYAEYFGMDFYDPELRARDRVILNDLQDVFELDSLPSAKPVSVEVSNPEYDKTFSRLSYGKGSVLLRMIENMIGLEVFNEGVVNYLRKYTLDNARRQDLWEELNNVAHDAGTLPGDLDLGTIMEGWTTKEGYPVISVSAVENGKVALSQSRFQLDTEAAASDSKWFVPVSIAYPGRSFDISRPTVYLRGSEDNAEILVEQNEFVLNVQETGYFRVNYDSTTWAALTESVTTSIDNINPLNRAQMLDDSFALARAGLLSYATPLQLSTYLLYEKDYIPLKASINSFSYLDLMFRKSPDDYQQLKDYINTIYSPIFEDYGYSPSDDEVYLDALIREELININCNYNDGLCITNVHTYFDMWMEGTNPDGVNPIPVDLKQPAYNTAIRVSRTGEEWTFLYERFLNCEVDSERKRMIYGLGSSEDVTILQDYLGRSIDETTGIRKQDTAYVYEGVGFSEIGRNTQMEWLELNYDAIMAYHGPSFPSKVSTIVSGFGRGANTQEEYDRINDFWNNHKADLVSVESSFLQTLDTIRININWMSSNYDFVLTWLTDTNANPPTPTLPPLFYAEPSIAFERPSFVAEGETVELKCTMSAYNAMLRDTTCKFISPEGKTLVVDFMAGGDVTEEGAGVVGRYTGIKDDVLKRTCGITIDSVDLSRDIGQWSCMMNENTFSYFHKGTFHLLTETEGFVKDIRLPRHLEPTIYSVDLIPHFEEKDFEVDGGVRIIFKHGASVTTDNEYKRRIVMNLKDIVIHEDATEVLTFRDYNTIIGHEYDLEREQYIIHLGEDLYSDDATTYHLVRLTFTSYLNDGLNGFYRSYYVDTENTVHTIAVTQFEKTSARKAFPLLDEPDVKARFQVRLGHKETMTATSNMEIVSKLIIPELEDYVYDRFTITPSMPSYLLAFMVSDLVNTTTANENFNIIHQAGKEDQAILAADAGPKILEYFEDYFQIPYPLNKMDMASIPDFSSGAMENWGLIKYRESSLLHDDFVSSQADRDRVLEVIAHELAHNWFGNLVTLEWWTDLWLNEGFATYYESFGKDFYDPELNGKDRITIQEMHPVFELDSLSDSKPLSLEVTNPGYDITYSRMSYGKGACIIRMLESAITTPAFDAGINDYLQTYQFDNANRNDLWAKLNEAAHENGTLDQGIDLADIMEGWAVQEGFPVVSVTENSDTSLTLTQKRQLQDSSIPEQDTKWWIPITVAYPGKEEDNFDNTYPSAWFTNSDSTIDINITGKPYVLNVQQTGYYRVNYEADTWMELASNLKTETNMFHRLNRAQLVDDAFALARADLLTYLVPVEMAKYLVDETDYIPIKAALNNLAYLELMFRDNDADHDVFRAFTVTLFSPTYDRLTFHASSEDAYLDVLVREEMIRLMCLNHYSDCVTQANNLYNKWMFGYSVMDNQVPVDIKAPVYETAIRENSQDNTAFNFLFQRLIRSLVENERKRMIYALSCTPREDQLLDLLGKSLDMGSGIRKGDTTFVYNGIGSQKIGRNVQMTWLEENYDRFKEYHGSSFSARAEEILEQFSRGSKTQEEYDRLNQFWLNHKNDLAGSYYVIMAALEHIEHNINWVANNYDSILEWIDTNVPTTNAPPSTTEDSNASTTTTQAGQTTTTTQGGADTTTTTQGEADTTTTTQGGGGDSTTTTQGSGGDTTTTTQGSGGDTTTTTQGSGDTTTTTQGSGGDSTTTTQGGGGNSTTTTQAGQTTPSGNTGSKQLPTQSMVIILATLSYILHMLA